MLLPHSKVCDILWYFLDSTMTVAKGKRVYHSWIDEVDNALLSMTTMVTMLKIDGSHMSAMLL